MGNSKIKLILASTSPRRKELLGHTKVPFEIHSENIPEITDHTDPIEYCRHLALMKGEAVTEKLKKQKPSASLLIVSADTIVCLKDRIFNKPADRNEAREFLEALSGQTHSVFTAVAFHLVHNGKERTHSFVDETKVTFDKITHEVMERYLDTEDSLDKAGAYGIQSGSLTFISKVEGSYSTVVGFPLSRFMQEVGEFLKQTFPQEDVWQNLF
jgi:septum formation protein